MQFNAYLNFDGTCREAFDFYKSCLGGEITMISTYGETPMADQMPPDMHSHIAHERLIVGDAVLMGSDVPPGRYAKPAGFSISIGIADPDQADRVFASLAEGGAVQMPIGPTFWAKRFGMVSDRYGVPWMVNCE